MINNIKITNCSCQIRFWHEIFIPSWRHIAFCLAPASGAPVLDSRQLLKSFRKKMTSVREWVKRQVIRTPKKNPTWGYHGYWTLKGRRKIFPHFFSSPSARMFLFGNFFWWERVFGYFHKERIWWKFIKVGAGLIISF